MLDFRQFIFCIFVYLQCFFRTKTFVKKKIQTRHCFQNFLCDWTGIADGNFEENQSNKTICNFVSIGMWRISWMRENKIREICKLIIDVILFHGWFAHWFNKIQCKGVYAPRVIIDCLFYHWKQSQSIRLYVKNRRRATKNDFTVSMNRLIVLDWKLKNFYYFFPFFIVEYKFKSFIVII